MVTIVYPTREQTHFAIDLNFTLPISFSTADMPDCGVEQS